MRLTFSTLLSAHLIIYKLDNSENSDYTVLPENTGTDGYWKRVDDNNIGVTLRDNGIFDLDNTLGLIDDPIIIALAAAPVTVQAIPTLSLWGLMLMIAFLSFVGRKYTKL